LLKDNALLKIKKSIEPFVGKKVKIKANRGRKKTYEKIGILEKVYPNIFVIRIEESPEFINRVSYSYSDVLTDSVELIFCAGNGKAVKIKH